MSLKKANSSGAFVRYLLAIALLLRIGLFIFSIWQDTTRWPDGQLRFTDVDYDVFTDAAKAMVAGRDVYEARPTYRYSPLIALILWPGHYVFSRFNLPASFYPAAYAFGKVVFIVSDIICALLQRNIIMVEHPDQQKSSQTISWLVGIIWLFNPITATVSVRGNAESVLGVFVLACLYCLLQNRIMLAGLLFGTCIHLKLYPIIYAPAIYLHLCDPTKPSVFRLPTLRHWYFGCATLASLLGLTGAGYWAYGWTFLHQSYFYHFTRVDFWHNFAPHFYPIYLFEGILAINSTNPKEYYDPNLFPYNYMPEWVLDAFFQKAMLEKMYKLFKILIMLPSLILIVVLSFRYWRKQSFAWFAITFTFVAFNKVCTSQYFLWWLVLLPPALAHIRSPPGRKGELCGFREGIGLPPTAVNRGFRLAALWFIGQAFWLGFAYLHEMVGPPYWGRELWLALWAASCVFLVVNLVILKCLMCWIEDGSAINSVSSKLDVVDKKSLTTRSQVKRNGNNEEDGVRKRKIVS
ncbi:unnamed protein product [Hymenolepis diminuta]|uniref:GPI alpha-1,4-mannosyltransferase I, catalytic subunit n=1 Tax=Hymenolepis diminuta TaxID=6216 RepID=A0A158QC92_HYMDI|nr:unnamed protein product [Hymenolepis diminuta]